MRELLDGILLLGGLQGLGLATVLARRRRDRVATLLLAALVGALSLMLLLGVLEGRWGLSTAPHLLALATPLPFLFGPLLYLYVVALTRPAARFEARWLVHGLPFAAALLVLLGGFYLRSGPEKLEVARAHLAGAVSPSMRFLEVLQTLQAVAYLVASWVALRRHARRVEGYFSDVDRIDLRWLAGMVLAHAAVWGLVIAGRLLRLAGLAPAPQPALSLAVQVGSALVVFATGYVSLWQPELFQKAQAAGAAEPARRPPPKYQRNRVADEEAAALAGRLTAYMADRKPYRDGALTLQGLADAVGATPHLVSQVLNLHLRKSFFVFVNAYRAEQLMAALGDPAQDRRGILELALEAGFNSKSTLNSYFKRYTGSTPTEYRLARAAARTSRKSAG